MNLKVASFAAFGLMVAGLAVLIVRHQLLAGHAVGLGVQVLAAVLMVSARLTFGLRSFHLTANTTAGGLVTSGPYAWIRHPIYAAILYFVWAAAFDHGGLALAAAVLVTIGAAIRIVAEESFLRATYPEYATYSARTRRVVPFLL